MSKKYFSIKEVSEMTSIPQYSLRYIEKSDPKMKIKKMRGRRYYNQDNIDYLKENYPVIPAQAAIHGQNSHCEERSDAAIQKSIESTDKLWMNTGSPRSTSVSFAMAPIPKIDNLILKFSNLKKEIERSIY